MKCDIVACVASVLYDGICVGSRDAQIKMASRVTWYEQLLPVLFNREHFGVKPGWIPAVFLTDGMGVCQCFRDRKLVKEARQSGAAGAGMAVAGVRAQVLEGRARTSIEFNFKYPASGGGKVAKRAETDPPAQTRLPGRPNPPRSA